MSSKDQAWSSCRYASIYSFAASLTSHLGGHMSYVDTVPKASIGNQNQF